MAQRKMPQNIMKDTGNIVVFGIARKISGKMTDILHDFSGLEITKIIKRKTYFWENLKLIIKF